MENRLDTIVKADMEQKKLVYISSPLRGDYEKNILLAREYCKKAGELGVIAFAPHLYFTQFYDDTIPEEREKGLELGLRMLDKCEELWIMGTKITQGMCDEIRYARELGIPVFEVAYPEDAACYPVCADKSTLLGHHSCIPGSTGENYENRILVMNYDALNEEYRSPPYQLWLATGGFGCSPDARGRRVFATSLADGEHASFYRQDFAGVVREEVLEQVRTQYFFRQMNEEKSNTSQTQEEGIEP